jgi:hypothetical protein
MPECRTQDNLLLKQKTVHPIGRFTPPPCCLDELFPQLPSALWPIQHDTNLTMSTSDSKTLSRAQITRFVFWTTALTSFTFILMGNRHALDAYKEYTKATALSSVTAIPSPSNATSSELRYPQPEKKTWLHL